VLTYGGTGTFWFVEEEEEEGMFACDVSDMPSDHKFSSSFVLSADDDPTRTTWRWCSGRLDTGLMNKGTEESEEASTSNPHFMPRLS
jgi:hypothetical protein